MNSIQDLNLNEIEQVDGGFFPAFVLGFCIALALGLK